MIHTTTRDRYRAKKVKIVLKTSQVIWFWRVEPDWRNLYNSVNRRKLFRGQPDQIVSSWDGDSLKGKGLGVG